MLNKNKYEFSNEEDFEFVYKIAKLQFRKIMKNFNESNFRTDIKEFFFGGDDYHKLFLYKNNSLLCGVLTYISNEEAFCDIFFWNQVLCKENTEEFRFFCEKLMMDNQKMGIKNMILPLDKSRFRHESFKKYFQKTFLSKEEFVLSDEQTKKEYKNNYLLKVNCESYFKKAEEAGVRILYGN